MTDLGDGARSFPELFSGLAQIGRHTDGRGCTRLAWTQADRDARTWFTTAARQRGLDVETDRNGNLWAWWGPQSADVVVTGSHLDTVACGGAYDGALGLAAGFAAVDGLRARKVQVQGGAPSLAVVAFADEEGARFNTPTFGSGLLTGRRDPADVLARRDGHGVVLADALRTAGIDPAGLGADHVRLSRIRAVVELHVEQGRLLVDAGHAVALCSQVWPRGRWRLRVDGRSDHAGTAELGDRRDPMLVLAAAITAARNRAAQLGCRATIGRVDVAPNGASTVPQRVTAYLDARAADDATLDAVLAAWEGDVRQAAERHGCAVALQRDARGAATRFDVDLTERLARRLAATRGPVPQIPTAAGHDAAVLAAHVPAAMLVVRNPTGVSYSPAEHATAEDCCAGVEALTDVLAELVGT